MIFFNHIHVDMFRELGCGSIAGLVSSHVYDIMLVEISGLIDGLIEDQGLYGPVNCGVGFP